MSETKPRVRTAWTDPDHVRLVYDLEERRNPKTADRSRGPDPDDPWAVGPGDDCGILPAGEEGSDA